MDYPQNTNEISSENDNKLKKHILEAEKRLKKVEQDYLHTSRKYEEIRSQWQSLYDERRRTSDRCNSDAHFIDWCKQLVKKLQNAFDYLPTAETTEETINHSLEFSMFNNGKSLAQENTMVFQQSQCPKLDQEAIRYFREINLHVNCIQRMSRSNNRIVAHDLSKEIKERNKCRNKALSNCTMICNPTSYESLRKSLLLDIEVVKKLIKELKKDSEEKLQRKQYAANNYRNLKQKLKHLGEKKEHLARKWDEEKKCMLEPKKENERRVGTYPEAEYIKMVNERRIGHTMMGSNVLIWGFESFTFS